MILFNELAALNTQAAELLATEPSLRPEALTLRAQIQDAANAVNDSGKRFNGYEQDCFDLALKNLDNLAI